VDLPKKLMELKEIKNEIKNNKSDPLLRDYPASSLL
jgi:hypothetical protein